MVHSVYSARNLSDTLEQRNLKGRKYGHENAVVCEPHVMDDKEFNIDHYIYDHVVSEEPLIDCRPLVDFWAIVWFILFDCGPWAEELSDQCPSLSSR